MGKCRDYRPDHNGECLNCDEPYDLHVHGFTKGDPRAVAAGKKGGAVSAQRRQQKTIARWLARFPGTTPEAAWLIYRAGYNAGTQAKYQRQKRKT